MSQAFSTYRKLEDQLSTLRREKRPQAAIDKHLEQMDDAWYRLSDDEKQELARERDLPTPSASQSAAPA